MIGGLVIVQYILPLGPALRTNRFPALLPVHIAVSLLAACSLHLRRTTVATQLYPVPMQAITKTRLNRVKTCAEYAALWMCMDTVPAKSDSRYARLARQTPTSGSLSMARVISSGPLATMRRDWSSLSLTTRSVMTDASAPMQSLYCALVSACLASRQDTRLGLVLLTTVSSARATVVLCWA
ncbi:hypothetical protein AcV5_009359 [Taiwanofungus camphoratus]|nr:hypothetical protein AcV5_009359 [Antrodia cinnamomea]